jgi:hypothetical protein
MNKDWRRKLWRARREDCAALGIIVAFFILFFQTVFFGGKFFVINDAFVYSYPLRLTAWAAIKQGTWPLWTPLIMSGYPLLSMSHIGLAYPLTWGYLFLPGHWAEQIYILAPYLLAPVFVYAYTREIGRSRIASVLAGLTFGYGGLMVSAVANNGMLPNALMWLPLALVALERSRKRPLIPCLLGATAAYGMSVLSGVGQGFVYVGAIIFAYAAFLVVAANSFDKDEEGVALRWKAWERWRPMFVAGAAAILSAGLAAFQILETMRAARRSVRSVLTYEIFTESSYTLLLALKTFLAPLHYIIHATAYVSPLAATLAILAVVFAIRSSRRDVRVFFWLGTAVAAWALMMGANTPLYRLLYHVPVINSFRAPPRHAFEWSFAIGILSAYGWDSCVAVFQRPRDASSRLPSSTTKVIVALLLLTLGVLALVLWQIEANKVPAVWDESNHYPKFPESHYLFWKVLLTLMTFSVVWLGWRISALRWRTSLLACAVALSCFAEPAIMASRWWWPAMKTAERFNASSPATKFLQTQAPEENRVYTRGVLWTDEMLEEPRLDSSNMTMPHGLRNTAGYEPLIMERYSRALGNVGMDASHPRPGFQPDPTIFEPQSHVLDLLNTTFVASYLDLSTEPMPPLEKEGIRFQAQDLSQSLEPGQSAQLPGAARECDTLAVVSTLAYAGEEADGATIAKLRLFAADGRVVERELRAGVDTSEWAHDRPDVLRAIQHRLAPVFDSFPGDDANSFQAHRYLTKIPLDVRTSVNRIEIQNVSQRATLALWKMTLYDSATRFSMPLPHYDLTRWEPAYEQDGVQVIRNKRVLPRVWLVAEAVAVDGEEALRRIRGESEHAFDPRRTALLEVSPEELPGLPGGAIPAESSARLVASEPNRLLIETDCASPSVLIVSEINYPGWAATIDGHEAPIHTADFLLRGIALPAGPHRVEMRYLAPAARTGAFISLLTLLLIACLAIYYRKKDTRAFRVTLNRIRRESRRLSGVKRRALRVGESRSGSFLLCLVFTALMIFNCVFPLNAVWATGGIVEPDCAQAMWNLWAVSEAVTHGQNPYATDLLYYPIGVANLSHQAIAAGFFPVTLLVKTLTRGSTLYPLYAYRLITLLCLTLLLYSSYWLLRELGFTFWAAATAAIAYSFSDFFMEHIAHINILASFFIPLAALCLVRFYRKPESTAGALAASLVLSLAVYFTESTLYIYLAALLFIILMCLFKDERKLLALKLRQAGAKRLLIASVIFLLLLAPYLLLLLTDDSTKPPLIEHSVYSANLAGFFIPHPQRTPLYGALFSSIVTRIKSGVGSYEVFTSFVLIIFAIVGVLITKNRLVRLAAAAALVFYTLSLGPTLKIFGTDTNLTMPYALLMRFPPFDWGRTPSRFVVIGMFFVMIVTASGLSWLGRFVVERRGRIAGASLMSVLLLWAIAEAYSPTTRQPVFVPPQNLEKSVSGPVLNLPIVSGGDGYAMLLQLFHRQPIATGYLARTSAKRDQHMIELKRLFDKGGPALCEHAASLGIKTIIIAPDSYIERVAPGMGPLALGQCSLNIIDLRTRAAGNQAKDAQSTLYEQPARFPRFETGTTLNFNTQGVTPFLWYGWSGIEPFSRWSDKGRAGVVFSLSEAGDRLLRIKMSPFIAQGKVEAQRVKIEVNGVSIRTLTLTEIEPQVYEVAIPGAVLREKNVLIFELPDAESPASRGLGNETRLLGINVQWMKLDAAQSSLTKTNE